MPSVCWVRVQPERRSDCHLGNVGPSCKECVATRHIWKTAFQNTPPPKEYTNTGRGFFRPLGMKTAASDMLTPLSKVGN